MTIKAYAAMVLGLLAVALIGHIYLHKKLRDGAAPRVRTWIHNRLGKLGSPLIFWRVFF